MGLEVVVAPVKWKRPVADEEDGITIVDEDAVVAPMEVTGGENVVAIIEAERTTVEDATEVRTLLELTPESVTDKDAGVVAIVNPVAVFELEAEAAPSSSFGIVWMTEIAGAEAAVADADKKLLDTRGLVMMTCAGDELVVGAAAAPGVMITN